MDTWGKLRDDEKQALRTRARTLAQTEIQERFIQRGDVTVFRIFHEPGRAVTEAAALAVPVTVEETETRMVSEVTLISPEDFDYDPEITADDEEAARPIDEAASAFESYYGRDMVALEEAAIEAAPSELPLNVDHRPNQSPIKDQGGRGTCVAHASMAIIEAHAHIPDDLSEQYAHYKFNTFLNQPHDQDAGLRTTDAAPFLARSNGRVCLEGDWPYIPLQPTINQMVAQGTYGPPAAAVNNQAYGIGAYKIITDEGLEGESIKNTRYLETLLHQGYDVVIGTWVSWDDRDNDGILDPVLDPSGNPIGRGGHAMLVAGYDRPSQYFIVKNSWGPTWGHDGYAYFHYDLVRSCFKYGFVVHSVVPADGQPDEEGWFKRLWKKIWGWITGLFGGKQ